MGHGADSHVLTSKSDEVVHWGVVASLHIGAQELRALREAHSIESTSQLWIALQLHIVREWLPREQRGDEVMR